MERGIYKDNRGREIMVVATNLPGSYPVLGVQLTRKKDGVSKDGIRHYTKGGKFYSNGGSKADALDLMKSKVSDLPEKFDCCTGKKIKMIYELGGKVVAGPIEVDEDSGEHEELLNDCWTEQE